MRRDIQKITTRIARGSNIARPSRFRKARRAELAGGKPMIHRSPFGPAVTLERPWTSTPGRSTGRQTAPSNSTSPLFVANHVRPPADATSENRTVAATPVRWGGDTFQSPPSIETERRPLGSENQSRSATAPTSSASLRRSAPSAILCHSAPSNRQIPSHTNQTTPSPVRASVGYPSSRSVQLTPGNLSAWLSHWPFWK